MYRWTPGTPKAARRRVQIPKDIPQSGQQPGWDQYAQDFAKQVNGGLMSQAKPLGTPAQASAVQMPATDTGDLGQSVRQLVNQNQPQAPQQGSAASQFDPEQYASDVGIGTGGSDFIEQAGLRHLGGLGAGGDPNEFVAGLMGSGLLSDGSQNARMNSSAFASAANNARNGFRPLPNAPTSWDQYSSATPGNLGPDGRPTATGGGAQTYGVPDQRAGAVSQPGEPQGSSALVGGLMTDRPSINRPGVDNIPQAHGQLTMPPASGMSGWRRFGRGLGAFAAGALAGPQAGEWAYNRLTPPEQRKPRRGP